MRRPGFLGSLDDFWFGSINDSEALLQAKADEQAATTRLSRASSEARHRGAGYHVRTSAERSSLEMLHPAYAALHPMFKKLRWGAGHRGI